MQHNVIKFNIKMPFGLKTLQHDSNSLLRGFDFSVVQYRTSAFLYTVSILFVEKRRGAGLLDL